MAGARASGLSTKAEVGPQGEERTVPYELGRLGPDDAKQRPEWPAGPRPRWRVDPDELHDPAKVASLLPQGMARLICERDPAVGGIPDEYRAHESQRQSRRNPEPTLREKPWAQRGKQDEQRTEGEEDAGVLGESRQTQGKAQGEPGYKPRIPTALTDPPRRRHDAARD